MGQKVRQSGETVVIDKASHSEVEQFAACERRHFYNYGHKIQSRSTSDALARGNVGHLALATYYELRKIGNSHESAADAALDIVAPEMRRYEVFDQDKLTSQLLLLLGLYFDEYEDQDEDKKILHVELAVDLQLTEEFRMPAKVDLVRWWPEYGVVAEDHKFCNDFFSVDKVDLSPQLPKYMAVLEACDIKVDGVMYNEIRYRNTKDNLANPSERFQRTPIPLTPTKVVTVMREQMMAARRISQLKALPLAEWESKIIRNPLHCQMCPFTAICDADLNDQDSDLVLNSYYESKVYN
jgi:CRISPR/Cas system-associated exonuclease Cas4 (RecB family)